MTALASEMSEAIIALAGPRTAYDTRESMIGRAARRAEISYRQAKSFFYREAANPAARAVDQVRNALARNVYDARSDFDRIRELEAEVAALRDLVAATLVRVEGAPPAQAGSAGAFAGFGSGAATAGASVAHSSLAGGARP